nr:MAG TPA: minor tail protein [Caudoviricetes sp.]
MDDLSVAIGLMGNAGLKGSNAGTALRAGLTNLVKPTKEMKSAMEKYGVELVKNADGSVDLMGTMQNLRTVLGELDETTQAQALATIFGKEAMSGWSAIVNASEGDFNKLTEAIANSDGTAQSMADTMMQGAKGALTEMKSALEGVAITIGERLTPFIEMLADGVSKLCTWFQSLSPATQTVIMVIAGLLALLGPLLILVGGAISLFANLSIVAGALGISVGALCSPFLIAIGVITAIVTAGILLCQNWDTIKAKASELGKYVSDKFNELKTNAINKFNELKTGVVNKFTEANTNVVNKANEIKTGIVNKFSEAKTSAVDKFNEIKTGITDKINSARDAVSDAIEKIKGFFDFEWSLPKIKLPHFSISGSFSLNPPKAPSFKVDWYSKGAIFKRPTVLGGMGIGDKHNGIGSNAEAILPINQLPKLLGLDKMQNGGVNLNIENFNNNTDKDIEYLANELAFYLSRKKIGMGGAF